MRNQILDYVLEQTLCVGDRVRIRPDRWPLLGYRDQTGTVVEMLPMPNNSCLVRVDDDPRPEREWFFYHVELMISDV
jgi:hypothetical protein